MPVTSVTRGEKVGKGGKWFCPYLPSRLKNATDCFLFFFQSKHAMFPSLCPLPDSPEAARRETIDYLAHKMDFVMFRVNI